ISRSSPFQRDPQDHPPRREPAEAEKSTHAPKGRTVVTANRFRYALPFKKTLKTLPHRVGLGVFQRTHFEQVTAMLIAHGQGFTALRTTSPPTLEIYCPHLIGCGCSPPAA